MWRVGRDRKTAFKVHSIVSFCVALKNGFPLCSPTETYTLRTGEAIKPFESDLANQEDDKQRRRPVGKAAATAAASIESYKSADRRKTVFRDLCFHAAVSFLSALCLQPDGQRVHPRCHKQQQRPLFGSHAGTEPERKRILKYLFSAHGLTPCPNYGLWTTCSPPTEARLSPWPATPWQHFGAKVVLAWRCPLDGVGGLIWHLFKV